MKINILFIVNSVLVGFLSIGAAYFTLIPVIMFGVDIERVGSAATQNYPMIGLWVIYFISIVFLPITLKKKVRKWQVSFIAFVTGIGIFTIVILR